MFIKYIRLFFIEVHDSAQYKLWEVKSDTLQKCFDIIELSTLSQQALQAKRDSVKIQHL